jgi:acyl-CoA synthetase (AMP-forming)/AMP-acid ligase II
VIAYLIPRLSSYKVPRVVEIRGDLPREASGKIFKRRLRDQYKTPTDQVGR